MLPGVYNEEVFESLDFVLAEAAKRDLRLILPIEVIPPCTSMAAVCLHGMMRTWLRVQASCVSPLGEVWCKRILLTVTLLPMQDYWLSIDRFVNWSDTAVTKNDFYTDWNIRQMYKNHLKVYTSRVNTFNNRTYATDPTIYAWDLLNEPRWCAPWPTSASAASLTSPAGGCLTSVCSPAAQCPQGSEASTAMWITGCIAMHSSL